MRWPRRRFRLRLNKRTITYATMYVTIVLVLFGVTIYAPMGRYTAVPALGQGPGVQPQMTLYERILSWQPGTARSILRAGLPLISFVEDSETGRRGNTSLAGAMSELFAGVNPDDPATFLLSQLPLIATSRGLGAPGGALRVGATVDQPAEVLIRVPGSSPIAPAPIVLPSTDPVVAIYHTHSKEAYLPDLAGGRTLKPEDAYSDDPNINMTRVGIEIAKALQELGIGSVHSPAVHDKDGKLGAYLRSEVTIQTLKRQYPTLKVFLDIHRDSQLRARTTALVRRQLMAKVMVVLGNDNPAWRVNYSFAAAFNTTLEDKYVGLSAGIFPTSGRFNQHHSEFAILLEVGGVENNLEEALRSARAIADTVAHLVKTKVVP